MIRYSLDTSVSRVILPEIRTLSVGFLKWGALGCETPDSDDASRPSLGYRRFRRMKQQASIADVDVGFRVGGKRDREILPEGAAKCSQTLEVSTELIVEGGPCDRCGFPQNVKAIGEPDIHVDRHRASRNLPDRDPPASGK